MSDDLKARLDEACAKWWDNSTHSVRQLLDLVVECRGRIAELEQERDRAVDTLNAQLSDEQAWAQNAARERDAALVEVERLRKGLEHIMKRGDAWCRERNAPGAYRRGFGDAAEEFRHMARQVLAQHQPADTGEDIAKKGENAREDEWLISRGSLSAEYAPHRREPINQLVEKFANALREKLIASEEKYDWNNGWLQDNWQDDLRSSIVQHLHKGDPRDVAAYCAFAWWHGWSVSPEADTGENTVRVPPDEVARLTEDAAQRGYRKGLEDAAAWPVQATTWPGRDDFVIATQLEGYPCIYQQVAPDEWRRVCDLPETPEEAIAAIRAKAQEKDDG